MILLLDNFDSFTYNLVDYFNQLNVHCDVIRNDVDLEAITSKEYCGVVISPGPETPNKSGILMKVIGHYQDKLPILGVCLGHQAIGEFFGSQLKKAIRPMHGKVSEIHLENNCLFNTLPKKIKVVRYNSLIIDNVKPPLQVIATSTEGEIMGVAHISLPIWGIQYHPEAALTEHGLAVLKNWVTENSIVVNI